MPKTEKKLFYLYCITKTKPARMMFEGIKTSIYPIYSQGLYAIIEKVTLREFSKKNLEKKLTDTNWVEKKVRLHEKIIEGIMRQAAVLPFKFGTIFQTEENVKSLLKNHAGNFKRAIADLEGKQEWGLKIYCNFNKFKNIIQKEDANIKKAEQEITSAASGKAYFLKKKKDELLNAATNTKISEWCQKSFERLKRESLEAKVNKLLPRQVTQRKEDMVLNVAFLLNKEQITKFNKTLDTLRNKYQDKSLSFEWTGPWPPYNFCSIKNAQS